MKKIMFTIDFIVNEEELKEDLQYDIPNTDKDLFELTFFMMPVKIVINGNEVFDPPDPWAKLPIMNLATDGLGYVKRLEWTRHEVYRLPEAVGILDFTLLEDGNVLINYDSLARVTPFKVPYTEVLEAFESFAQKVRLFLHERVSDMYDHPFWGPWLRGERD